MKLRFVTFLLLVSMIGFSQSHDKGTFSFNLGWDAGLHGTEYTSKLNGTQLGSPDTSAAGTSLFRINAHYNPVKWLSAGLDFRAGSYLEDPDNPETDGNKINMLGLALRLYPVNRDKFAWFIGANFGRSGLEINRKLTAFNIPAKYTFNSGHLSFETGFNWYFAKNGGLNFGLGYSQHNFLMQEFYLNNSKQNIDNFENRLRTKGVHFNIGLAIQFGG
jgi:hypothetical protein